MNRILIFLSVLAITACTKTVDFQLEPSVILIPSENQEQRITLTAEDKEYTLLSKWLEVNKSNWNSTSGQFPGGVYIVSGDHGIQINRTHVVIYSTKQPKPKAIYIQKVRNGDLNAVREIAR